MIKKMEKWRLNKWARLLYSLYKTMNPKGEKINKGQTYTVQVQGFQILAVLNMARFGFRNTKKIQSLVQTSRGK